MASSSQQQIPALVASCQNLTIGEEEEGGLVLEGDCGNEAEYEFSLCLVGRFLVTKSVNFQAMQDTLIPIWQPMKGIEVKELPDCRYLFQFFHIRDMERVLQDGLWSFVNNTLLLHRLMPGEQFSHIPLNVVEL